MMPINVLRTLSAFQLMVKTLLQFGFLARYADTNSYQYDTERKHHP